MSLSRPINITSEITRQISGGIVAYVVRNLGVQTVKDLDLKALALTTTLTTVIGSFITACVSTTQGTCSTLVKWFVPLSALTSFGLQLKSFVEVLLPNYDFGSEALEQCINLLIENYFAQIQTQSETNVVPNALSYESIIRKVVAALVLIVTVGLSKWKLASRELLTWMSISEKTFTVTDKISDWIVQLIETMTGYDLTSNAAIRDDFSKLLKESEELITSPVAAFIIKPQLYERLRKLKAAILELQTKKLNTEQFKTYSSIKLYLNTAYVKLLEIETALKLVTEDNDRPACVAYLLTGEPGIGKSELIKYLNRTVGKTMGYSPRLYDLAKGSSAKFHQIYAQEELGIMNEFGGLRNNMDQVSEINSILSSDPVTLEGAHLEFKYQQCKLKLVGMTANRKTFDFNTILTEQANIALMSRIERFHIADPLYTTRREENPHRKQDFSHLTVTHTKPNNPRPETISDCWAVTEHPTTVADMVRQLTRHCCIEEKRFNKKVIDNCGLEPQNVDIITAMVSRNLDLDRILQNMDIQPNARTNFFVARFQGEIGLGKTTMAKQTALVLSNFFNMTIDEIDSAQSFGHRYTTPTIAIVDDVSIHLHQEEYLNWINSMPENSIVFICTNHIVPRTKMGRLTKFALQSITSTTLCTLNEPDLTCTRLFSTLNRTLCDFVYNNTPKVYDCANCQYTQFSSHPGLYRRIGLCGNISTSDGVTHIGTESLTVTFDEGGGYIIDDTHIVGADVSSIVVDRFIEFMRKPNNITTINTEAPDVPIHLTILIKDLVKFKEASKTPNGYYGMLCEPETNEAGSIIPHHPELLENVMKSTRLEHWVLPNIPEDATIEGVIKPMLYRLKRIDPSLSVQVKFQDQQYVYTCGYLYTMSCFGINHFSMHDRVVRYRNVPITPSDIVKILCYPEISISDGVFKTYSGTEIVEIRQHFLNHESDPSYGLYNEALKTEKTLIEHRRRMQKFHPLAIWCKQNSKGFLLASGLAGAILSAYVVYTTYNAFFPQKEDLVKVKEKKLRKALTKAIAVVDSNSLTVDDTHDQLRQHLHKRIDANMHTIEPSVADLLASIHSKGSVVEGCKALIGEYSMLEEKVPILPQTGTTTEDSQQRQAERAQEIAKKQQEKHQKKMMLAGNWRENLQPNAIPKSDRHNDSSELVKIFSSKLVRAVCRVNAGETSTYGLLYGGNKLVTVNHGKREENAHIVWSPNSETKANVYAIRLVRSNMDRDLAIYEVIDKKFPPMPSLHNLFPRTLTRMRWTSNALFVRPFESLEIYVGMATYSGVIRTRGDLQWDEDSNYDPIDIITYSHLSLDDSIEVFQPGDCGLPLLLISNKQIEIVGIHNAKHGSEAYFSPLFREELNLANVIPNSGSAVVKSTLPPFKEYNCIPNWNEFLHTIEPSARWKDHPEIATLGYCKEAVIYSNPKHNKELHYDDSFEFDIETWPSPVMYSDLTKKAREFLPKTDQGKPCAMLAQVKKIFSRKPFKPDQQALAMAKHIQLEKYQDRYGLLRKLRKHEAVNGVIGESMDRIRFKTSAGAYLKKKFNVVNKRNLFYNVNDMDQTKPPIYCFNETPAAVSVSSDYDLIIASLESGCPVMTVVKDNPKVELLPIMDVVDTGKVRIFQEVDLAMNLVLRAYTGDFINKQHEHHLDDSAKIGLNPYYDLDYALRRVPKHFELFSTDISRLDKNLSVFFMNWYFQLLNHLTGQKYDVAYRALAASLGRRLHIQRGTLYIVEGGNPSGISGTTSLNCVAIEIMLIYAYVRQCNKISRTDLINLSEYTNLIISFDYGDDKVVYSHPGLDFEFEDFKEAVLECGLDCKCEDPQLRPDGYYGTFCSRTLMMDQDRDMYVVPLKKASITQGLWWIDTRKIDILPEQFSLLLFEASLHDEDFYNQVVYICKFQLRKFFIPLNLLRIPTYSQQREHLKKFYQGLEDCHMLTGMRTVLSGDLDVDLPQIRKPKTMTTNTENWVNAYNEYCAKNKLPTNPVEEASRDAQSLEWEFHVLDEGFVGIGTALQKSRAKNTAYQQLYQNRFGKDIKPNSETSKLGLHKHTLRYTVVDAGVKDHYKVTATYDDDLLAEFTTRINPSAVSTRLKEFMTDDHFKMNIEEYLQTGFMSPLKFLQESLVHQHSVAQKISNTTRADVCIYDGCGQFDEGLVEVIDGTRCLNSHGKRAVLSAAAQKAFSLANYSVLAERFKLNHTIVFGGIWVKYAK